MVHDEPSIEDARAAPTTQDFMTDGTLVALCDELSGLTGSKIEFRDIYGRRVVSDPDRGWRFEDAPPPEGERIPIHADGVDVGSLVITSGADNERVATIVELLARFASEACREMLELSHWVKAMSVMYRLNALLAGGSSVDRMLSASLESALEVLELDAGSLVLLPADSDGIASSEDEADLELRASRALSTEFLRDTRPLSKGREFDRLALRGDGVAIADLLDDPRVLDPDHIEAEGLRSFINAGMIWRGRPIGVIRLYGRTPRIFTVGEQRLVQAIGQQAASAVQQARLLVVQKEEQRIQRQLSIAGDVQTRMMPHALPAHPRLDIAARCRPSSELSGDFYDVLELEGAIGLVVGDVVGKGIAAALLMSSVRATIRAHVDDRYAIEQVISRANRALCRDTLANEFATVWFGVVDPMSRSIAFCSAGHDRPVIFRRSADGYSAERLNQGDLVIGVDEFTTYQRHVVPFEPGDILVMFTDGVSDAQNFENERYGQARMIAAITSLLEREPNASSGQILDHVLWSVRQFAGLRPQVDDETLIVTRFLVEEKA